MTLCWLPDGPARGSAVLLHGLVADAGTWWRVGPGLAARGWRTYAFDLAGHGDMPRLGRPMDMPTLADSVVDQIAAVPELEPPIDLLAGHDLGALVALTLVDRRPDLARALVLEEPPGTVTCSRKARARQVLSDAEVVRTDPDRLRRRERIRNPGWTSRDVEHAVEGIAKADAAAIASALRRRPWMLHLTDLIATSSVPVMVIAAPDQPGRPADDPPSALGGLDREAVQRLVPAGHFAVLSGGHWLHRDQPDRWLARTTAFADVALGPLPPTESPAGLGRRTHANARSMTHAGPGTGHQRHR